METVLEKNLQYLRKCYPHVFKVVANHEGADNLQLGVETAKNGSLNIKVKIDGNHVFLHSNYDQMREVQAILGTLNLENKDTLIIFGFGMGYHIEKIIRTYPNMNKIVIEPSADIFKCMLTHKDITKLLRTKNVELMVTDNPDQIAAELIALYQKGHISALEFFVMPSYGRLYGHVLQQTKEAYVEFLRIFNVNVRTQLLFKKHWFRNFLMNLKQIPDSADLIDLAEKFQNIPAILVSAGPSLNKNIKLLREIGDHALILAAGSTISVLQSVGIKPHIMFGIDGGPIMSEIYSKVKWTDVLFAYILSLHHESLDFYTGPKVYVKTNAEPHVDWMEEATQHISKQVQSGGSCANVALDFLNKLGCNPVIFIGQDLAFTDMEFYAEGHANKESMTIKKVDQSKLRLKKDIYDNDIYTADNLLTMAQCFENCIARQPKGSIFINATEGGLPLKGTQVMTFREAIDKYCFEGKGVKSKLDLLVTQSRRDNKKLKAGLEDFITLLQRHSEIISEISKQRIKLVDRILNNIEKNKLKLVTTQSKKLLSLTEELEKNDLFQKVLLKSSYEILLVIKNNNETMANQAGNTREKMRILYQGLKNQFELIEDLNANIGMAGDEALNRLGQEV